MDSDQERLVKGLLENSLGASFVFAPERYFKGGKADLPKQPSDIVWACNNCVILMEMTESNTSTEKIIEHNLKKFPGALRFWKEGFPLTGKSANQDFEVYFNDFQYKILISVVHGNNAVSKYHFENIEALNRKEYGISVCVTIPQSILEYISRFNGSAVDLLNFIDKVRDKGESITEPESLKLITHIHRDSFAKGNPFFLVPNFAVNQDLSELVKVFRLTRSYIDTNKSDKIDESGSDNVFANVQAIYNDLSWTNATKLLYEMINLKNKILSVPIMMLEPSDTVKSILIPPYNFVVEYIPETFPGDMRFVKNPHREKLESAFPEYKLVSLGVFLWDQNRMQMPPVIGCDPKQVKSLTESILEKWTL